MTPNEIPVFFSIDDAYAPCLAVALRSAAANADPARRYRAFVLHKTLDPEHEHRLGALATDNFAIEFVRLDDEFAALTDRMSNRLRCDYFTLTIFFRLFIADMYPELDKAIYLDSDVAVVSDLAEMYEIDLGDDLLGCVEDASILGNPRLVAYTHEAVGVDVPPHRYVNSGVLLMNLRQLREERFAERFLDLLNRYHIDCVAPDQDYINGMCRDRIRYLDGAWDAMPTPGEPEMANPKVIHYNLFSKPWLYDGIAYADVFWKYAAESGYEADLLETKRTYTDEQRAADASCMGLLVERATKIIDDKLTFKKLYDSGTEVRL